MIWIDSDASSDFHTTDVYDIIKSLFGYRICLDFGAHVGHSWKDLSQLPAFQDIGPGFADLLRLFQDTPSARWIVYYMENLKLRWIMTGGYPYFRKTPYRIFLVWGFNNLHVLTLIHAWDDKVYDLMGSNHPTLAKDWRDFRDWGSGSRLQNLSSVQRGNEYWISIQHLAPCFASARISRDLIDATEIAYPLVIKHGNGKFPMNGGFCEENHWFLWSILHCHVWITGG